MTQITEFKTEKAEGFFVEIPENAFNFSLIMEQIQYNFIKNETNGIGYIELPISRVDSEDYEILGLTDSLSKRQKSWICDSDHDGKGYFIDYEDQSDGYGKNVNYSFQSLIRWHNLEEKNYLLIIKK